MLATRWHGAGDEAFSSLMDTWSFPFTVPHSPTLATPLIASIYYSVTLKLLNYVKIGAAEEQGEAKAVDYGETCLAGVHGAPHPRHPAFHTSTCYSCAVCPHCAAAAMGQGEGGHSTGSGVLPQWVRVLLSLIVLPALEGSQLWFEGWATVVLINGNIMNMAVSYC